MFALCVRHFDDRETRHHFDWCKENTLLADGSIFHFLCKNCLGGGRFSWHAEVLDRGNNNVPVMRGCNLKPRAFDANSQRDVNVIVSLWGPHSWKGNQMASRYMVSLWCAVLMLRTK